MTWEAPAFGRAYESSRLSWAKALAILPVVRERVAAEWVQRATEVSIRRLVDEVEWALDMQDLEGRNFASTLPPEAGAKLERPERQTCAQGGGAEWVPAEAEISFSAPASVAALLESAIAAFTPPLAPRWVGLERLLTHVEGEWRRHPRHRDPIFERDGWRCRVPGCSGRRNLHDHHIRFRSLGGDNAQENRATVCAWHHLRGIHGGRVRAWGSAVDDVRWELGLRRGVPPLLRFNGDRYVSNRRGAGFPQGLLVAGAVISAIGSSTGPSIPTSPGSRAPRCRPSGHTAVTLEDGLHQ
jgi:hypothetical protein